MELRYQDTNGYGAYGLILDINLQKRYEFQINSKRQGNQFASKVTDLNDGFVATWYGDWEYNRNGKAVFQLFDSNGDKKD